MFCLVLQIGFVCQANDACNVHFGGKIGTVQSQYHVTCS